MKLWLDDLRTPPDESWTWVKTSQEAMEMLDTGSIVEISLDHDLGSDLWNGYTVACHIENLAHHAGIKPPKWKIHSANPVGAENIARALESADKEYAKRQDRTD